MTELPLEKGTRVRRVARFLGRRIDYVLEVAELEPGSRLLMRSVKSPFPMVVIYTFNDVPGGTRAAIRIEGDEPGGVYRLGGALMPLAVKRSLVKDLRNLKSIVESLQSS